MPSNIKYYENLWCFHPIFHPISHSLVLLTSHAGQKNGFASICVGKAPIRKRFESNSDWIIAFIASPKLEIIDSIIPNTFHFQGKLVVFMQQTNIIIYAIFDFDPISQTIRESDIISGKHLP